ncbi:sulfite exporter TauE/SafE family protein [Dellaglioa algida]|uniref:Probable membrane transporter protein n=2 Tax=Dellaglioa algida TaxID=105612 RepID=A0A5C6MCK3_9LACO|nr:sulfite exporter TauE/SafE family protein [Dellaglioa algida]MDK1716279.1 sulfite exporter TauE/SafE family protein [Dellaglioa algida]MDK1722903.1 sulfite exporter TauE/SafE family protein [Dellaglioa algida]MDK1724522.1 sulfite exporter TauE/SafE family protein [Dellaglioa algida]MDK1740382.1 sulfite exporter TauE/SafE family protein [Dellaglioa algida]TWW11792.1 hypothetical protein LABALGLTS371_00030 [Dellaglioa algida]
MGIGVIYFLVIIIANTLGAISGMGGGILIKPIFDGIGYDSISAISFYSAVAVFTMSVVSTYRKVKEESKFNVFLIVWSAMGAIIGGVGGKNMLDIMLGNYSSRVVLSTQIFITILTIIFALFYSFFNWKSWSLSGFYWYIICGLILGFFASFLGIGGGPINVTLLMIMFGMGIKDAAVYSIAIILFSQGSKILAVILNGDLIYFDLSMLFFIIPAAILGGLFGSILSHTFSDKYVENIFRGMLIVVIFINLANGIVLFN